ncbi:MAG: alpha/beta fold hydrolase [Candidatus Paceibacterota bacterium]
MEKFEIKNRKGLKIVGKILRPENPIGLSFVMHGLSGYKEELHIEVSAQTLFENNYIVVNFDATNSRGESEGKYEDATMQKHYDDLVDVINWSKTQSWYKEPFVLAGHSMGGFAVTKYAEEFPVEVKAVFSFAAPYSGKDNLETHNKFRPEEIKEWKETGWMRRVSNSKPGFELNLPWSHMEERLKHDLKPMAYKITMPILFVVGEDDKSCLPSDQKKFYDLLPEDTIKEVHVVKGASHVFRTPEQLETLKNIFNNWLKNLK